MAVILQKLPARATLVCGFLAAVLHGQRPGDRVAPRLTNFRVTVSGVTNTQAVLNYAAPEGLPCNVKVSRQQSLSPLVVDVDPSLFAGADKDSRPGTLTGQNSRIFIVGKRLTQKGLDGKNYSRALEAYAPHYFQVTCGSASVTGSFTTANIPPGMTHNEVPQVDESNPGEWMIPTMLQDRTQAVA